MNMTASSKARIEAWFDEFIRSDYVTGLTSDKDSDLINHRERAERCYNAAECGADGKTPADYIEDWREALRAIINGRPGHYVPGRFLDAVEDHIDSVESQHEFQGSLFQEIG
jgi:hypothetical protein